MRRVEERTPLSRFEVRMWRVVIGALSRFRRLDVVWQLAWLSRLPGVAIGMLVNRLWRSTFEVSPTPVVVGSASIWISTVLTPDERELVPRLAAALDMIATVQPSRGARLRRLHPHLLVAPTLGVATFAPGANLLTVDPRTLREPREVIAAALVHESNHARLASRQVLHPLLRARYERLARKDALLFAERLYAEGDLAGAHRVRSAVMRTETRSASERVPWQQVRSVLDRLGGKAER